MSSGPQMKATSMVVDADPVLEQLLALFPRDAAVEQFDVLLLAAHHVDQVQALAVDVLELGQFVLEDHADDEARLP